ncbi:hypothetical protein Ahy_A02g007131 [Arachis hypogaea]|uniref:Uncharacterized protein n=1 Tax=Arachis hypogaea TaxID=3818 RepID=A0A445EBK0_ARAHY|nr:hypothetical protein Ahy_A02g007131 [Arachis hypogaea]
MTPDLESGLHVIKGDAKINKMRDNKSRNKEISEITFTLITPVSVLEVVDCEKQVEHIILSDLSFSSDGYEITEDEPYKSPPPRYEDADSNEDSEEQRKIERLEKKKKMATPKKRASQDPNVEVKDDKDDSKIVEKIDPSKKNDNAGPSKSGPTFCPRTAKKRTSKKYSVRKKTHGGVSNDEEERTAFDAFNEETKYGEVEFKVAQTFITMENIKNILKDYFVFTKKDVVKTLVKRHNYARDYNSNLADRH